MIDDLPAAPRSDLPALSVLLVTLDGFESVRHTVSRWTEQAVPELIELVVVGERGAALEVAPELAAAFHSVRTVHTERSPAEAPGRCRDHGVRAASAPIIAVSEEHSYPAPDYAEVMLEAHRGPWGVVGPAMMNANPGALISWANLLVDYGHWVAPIESGELEHVPGHNSAYKRDLLLDYGDRLGELMDTESLLHQDLANRGHPAYLEPRARVYHFNSSQLLPSVLTEWLAGRYTAGARLQREGWQFWRRLLYVLGAPLIPLRQITLLYGGLRRRRWRGVPLWRLLPLHALLFASQALGEAAGFAAGIGDSYRRYASFEFQRSRYLCRADRDALRSSRSSG